MSTKVTGGKEASVSVRVVQSENVIWFEGVPYVDPTGGVGKPKAVRRVLEHERGFFCSSRRKSFIVLPAPLHFSLLSSHPLPFLPPSLPLSPSPSLLLPHPSSSLARPRVIEPRLRQLRSHQSFDPDIIFAQSTPSHHLPPHTHPPASSLRWRGTLDTRAVPRGHQCRPG